MKRIKLVDLELSRPVTAIEGLRGYEQVLALLRWHAQPLGHIRVPVCGDHCAAATLGKAIIEEKNYGIIFHLLRSALKLPAPAKGWTMRELLEVKAPPERTDASNISVIVCTRDRTESLERCLRALERLNVPPLEILVIDNAPRTSATRCLIEREFPKVRYILEPRPGLDWARNRAIHEACGEIVAYTDDDVIVDGDWTRTLGKVFMENSNVMAVTGLVVPFELETESQVLFEEYGGFGRGFERKWYRSAPGAKIGRVHGGAGKFGTGANMAFRKKIFEQLGGFDPALDVGTVTQGGGDLEMFFRVLKAGMILVYEPAALVRHQHRCDMASLETQIASNGVGFYSYLVRSARAFPEERRGIFFMGVWWLWHWSFRRWVRAFFRPSWFPRKMLRDEFVGSFRGLFRYQKARRRIAALKNFGAASGVAHVVPTDSIAAEGQSNHSKVDWPRFGENRNHGNEALGQKHNGIAVRTVEISRGLKPLRDINQYPSVRIYVMWKNRPLGFFDFDNHYDSVGAAQLADVIVDKLGLQLLERMHEKNSEALWADIIAELSNRFLPEKLTAEALPRQVPVSIVIATYDRPEDLRVCLHSLADQITSRRVEIVVVDNHPESNLTQSVVEDFPGIKLVRERRGGLSYARNAGFAASSGEILIAVDDDVIAPPDWLERIVAPFARNDVMVVTGNVFPVELETSAQIHFETYGGLGRGFERQEFNREWFDCYGRRSVPTWKIGATANAAFRATILADPRIGLLDEALGAGSPTGCSEDTYLFYRVLKAGGTIIYEPDAHVWHRHRREEKSFRKQIYNYSKGHVAYHLTTLLRDRDCRALTRLGPELAWLYLRRIILWCRGYRSYPLALIWLELAGTAAGPFALWRSRRRVRKLGRSEPYIPVSERPDRGKRVPRIAIMCADENNDSGPSVGTEEDAGVLSR